MHHKRKHPENRRSGCFLFKPHEANHVKGSKVVQTMQERRARQRERSMLSEVHSEGIPLSNSVTQCLEAAALALPRSERARLAERLIASLDENAELEEAWATEIRRRLDAIDRGEVELIPAEDVIAEARRRIGR